MAACDEKVSVDAKNMSIEIDEVNLSDLIPADYNPRKGLSLGEKRALRNSLQKFGMVYPLVVNRRNNVIVGGHQRYAELKELKAETVPVVWVDMDEEQERRANIQLNSIEADWDLEKLQEVVYPWTTDEVEDVGFTRVEASALLAGIYMNPDKKKQMLAELRAERQAAKEEQEEHKDDREVKFLTCPKCGYRAESTEFYPEEKAEKEHWAEIEGNLENSEEEE